MDANKQEGRTSPASTSSTGSCIVVDCSESPARSHDSESTDPTSVSSHDSRRVNKSRQVESFTTKDTVVAKTPPKQDIKRADTALSIANKTRRSPRNASQKLSARQISSSSTAPLLKSRGKTAFERGGQTSKSSILKYLVPTRDMPAKRKNAEGNSVETEKANSVRSPTKKMKLLHEGAKAIDNGWNVERLGIPTQTIPDAEKPQNDKRRSTRIGAIAEAVTATKKVLQGGKEKLKELGAANGRGKRKSDEAAPGVSDEPASKRTKLTMSSEPKKVIVTEERLIRPLSMSKKTWLSKGLYAGQKRDREVELNEIRKKASSENLEAEMALPKENSVLPLPMFKGERDLTRKTARNFELPFDVFSPLPPGQPRPDEWWKKRANRFVGDAAIEWKKTKPLPTSRCLCKLEDGCGEDCHNRYMLYECDDGNCSLGPEYCTNRAFAELKERTNSGKQYQIGVEVMKTANKGFGVRSCRTFQPHQIIVEYTGEIITQEECERRIREEYKNNESYYLMTFDQNMIIDATRGSIARFVNHSCEPNCRMVKWTVAGKPRMALFAGDKGIMTGEELSYDYNFDPFSRKNIKECRCGAARCRGVLGPKLSKEKEAKLMEELKEKRRLEEIAAKKAEAKRKREKEKEKRPKGNGIWGGRWEWVKV